MKAPLLLSALAVAAVLLCFAGLADATASAVGTLQAPPVLDLTDKDFESTTQAATGMTSMPSVLVLMHVSWCAHCKDVQPEIDKFAGLYSAHNTRVVRVNCDDAPSTCRRFGVKGYPTIVLLKSSQMYRYKAARTANSMTAFAQSPTVAAEPVPAPLGWLDEIKWWGQIIVTDFERLHKDNPVMLMGMLGALFIVFLCILVLAVSSPNAPAAGPGPARPRPSGKAAVPGKPSAKPAAAAAPRATATAETDKTK